MKTRIWLLVLVAVVLGNGGAAWADGDFYVVAGGGTPVGTKITSLPYEIKNSGFYFLTGDLTSSGHGIIVSVDNVTIDLMGFSIIGPMFYLSPPYGIYMSGRSNVTVRNGTVRRFDEGINEDSSNAANHRISNIRAVSNAKHGINLLGKNHMVKNCTCSSNGTSGIFMHSGTITGSVACDNKSYGMSITDYGSMIGNVANNNTYYGFVIPAAGAMVLDQNSATGNGSTNYSGGGNSTIWGRNAGNPPHMNYPATY